MRRLVFAASLLPLLAGCQQIQTQIDIDAPPRVVWQTLTEFGSYGDWNPYHTQIDGDCADEALLRVRVDQPDGDHVDLEPRIYKIDWHRQLTWGGGRPGLSTSTHTFRLEPLDGGRRTRLHNDEDLDGLVAPFADVASIEAGHQQLNAALKARVEAELAPVR